MKSFLADTRPLRNRHFRRLWTANIVTVVGAQLTVVAVPAQIYAETGSSAYVGLTGVFGLVPLVVFGLWGGALADVIDRRTLLVCTTIGLIVTSTLFWLQAWTGSGNVWLLLGLFAVQQAFFAVNQPTRSAVLPRLLPLNLLPAANSLNMTVMQAGAIGGPLIAGALIPVFGFSWLYLIDTLTLIPTLGAVLSLPPLPIEGTTGSLGFKAVLDGLGYLRGQPVLLMSFLVDIIAMVFGMPRALFPEIAHVELRRPRRRRHRVRAAVRRHPDRGRPRWRLLRLGLADLAPGRRRARLGGRLGARDDGLRPRRLARGPWQWPMLVAAVLMLVIGGAADMASAAFRTSMLQSAASDAVRGRLQGVFTVVVVGGPRIADVAHGAVAVSIGAAATAAGGGLLVVIGTVLAAVAFPAFVRYKVVAATSRD